MDQIRQQRTRNPSGMTESMTRLHQQLEDNLKKKTDEIMRVKSQKKDLELKLEGFKSKSRRLTQLTTEIEGMKQQVVAELQQSVSEMLRMLIDAEPVIYRVDVSFILSVLYMVNDETVLASLLRLLYEECTRRSVCSRC